ncbi:hypothetical protein PT974_04051 [Cladobotryum mycophilum]|uniref:Uncharacterized protein n=1 Tax=Cladobotryum mycophilum TaxID=491253 RepID=A0ABR0STZ0_9HYPO
MSGVRPRSSSSMEVCVGDSSSSNKGHTKSADDISVSLENVHLGNEVDPQQEEACAYAGTQFSADLPRLPLDIDSDLEHIQ